MTFNQLRTFLAVAETLGLRAAARSLNITQPAISKAMRELERQLGVPLLERTGTGVVLTEYGQAFRLRASFLLEEMRRTHDELTAMRSGFTARLSIAVGSAVAMTTLPVAYNHFNEKMPLTRVFLTEGVMPEALTQLRDGSVDFAVLLLVPGTLGDEFDEVPLFTTSLAVCASRNHPLARKRHLHDLVDALWIAPTHTEQGGNLFQHLFSSNGLPLPTRQLRCQSFTVGLGILAHAEILTALAEPLVRKLLKLQGVVSLKLREPMPSMVASVITRKGVALSESARLFIQCLRVEAARDASVALPKN